MNLQPHPLADLFPMMGDTELSRLAADQRANLDTAISQLQAALTSAKFAGNPHLTNLIREAIAEGMADARLRDR